MTIAILGWGSLVWDKRNLRLAGDWQTGGPVLPIEFSRVSSDGRLTLVIDPLHGVPVATLFARSEFPTLNKTIANLREREGTTAEKIGYVNLVSHTACDYSRRHHPAACDAIQAWAQANQWQAVIWTALISNFESDGRPPFSVPAALAYLRGLTGEKPTRALEYIQRAPEEVDTPVRRLLLNGHTNQS
jgi:hypothetical protein